MSRGFKIFIDGDNFPIKKPEMQHAISMLSRLGEVIVVALPAQLPARCKELKAARISVKQVTTPLCIPNATDFIISFEIGKCFSKYGNKFSGVIITKDKGFNSIIDHTNGRVQQLSNADEIVDFMLKNHMDSVTLSDLQQIKKAASKSVDVPVSEELYAALLSALVEYIKEKVDSISVAQFGSYFRANFPNVKIEGGLQNSLRAIGVPLVSKKDISNAYIDLKSFLSLMDMETMLESARNNDVVNHSMKEIAEEEQPVLLRM